MTMRIHSFFHEALLNPHNVELIRHLHQHHGAALRSKINAPYHEVLVYERFVPRKFALIHELNRWGWDPCAVHHGQTPLACAQIALAKAVADKTIPLKYANYNVMTWEEVISALTSFQKTSARDS